MPKKKTPTPAEPAPAEPLPDEATEVSLPPLEKKRGEGKDHLRRRQEWFQKRSGKG